MWSTRTDAEFIKPLATPVLVGMMSSLLHVLIVTLVIFTTSRERELAPRPGILLIQFRIDFISGVPVIRSCLLDFLGFEGEKHEQGRSNPSVLR